LNIESTWIGSKYAINTISGTSMASPHVAGLLAYFLSLQPSSDSGYFSELKPAKLKENIIAVASQDALSDIPDDTPNLLIYNGGGSGNLSDIFDGKRYVHKPESSSDVPDLKVTKETLSDAETFLERFEDDVMNEVKAAFEKARAALSRNAA
jgi:cerevisin